jgi:hypothetical protein
MDVADVMSGQVRFDCRGRRPGILDAVHALRPARSEVVVKLGACSLTQLRRRDTHALCGPCMMRSMGGVVHGCVPTLCLDRLGQYRRYPMGRPIAAVDPGLCGPSTVTQCMESIKQDPQQLPLNPANDKLELARPR